MVFVEVKTRTGDGFGGLAEAVTAQKVCAASAGRRRCGWRRSRMPTRRTAYRCDRGPRRPSPRTRADAPQGGAEMGLGRVEPGGRARVDGVIVRSRRTSPGRRGPAVNLVGLPDTALQGSRDRVRAAITNAATRGRKSRLDVGVVPGHAAQGRFGLTTCLHRRRRCSRRLHQDGPGAIGKDRCRSGELALDGRVRPVHGVLPAVLAAKQEGLASTVVVVDNLAEASLIDGSRVVQAPRGNCRPGLMGKGDLAGLGCRVVGRGQRSRWQTWPTWSDRPRPAMLSRCAAACTELTTPSSARENDAGRNGLGCCRRSPVRACRGQRHSVIEKRRWRGGGGGGGGGEHIADYPTCHERPAPHPERPAPRWVAGLRALGIGQAVGWRADSPRMDQVQRWVNSTGRRIRLVAMTVAASARF